LSENPLNQPDILNSFVVHKMRHIRETDKLLLVSYTNKLELVPNNFLNLFSPYLRVEMGFHRAEKVVQFPKE